MKIIIFASSNTKDNNFINEYIEKDDLIISCDGGLQIIDSLGIIPSVMIGDFDSVDENVFRKYENIKKIEFPKNKNFTDLDLAIEYAKDLKVCDEILIFGATGGRADHYIANIFLLEKYIDFGLKIKLIDKDNILFVLDDEVNLKKSKKYLSLIPLTEKVIVSIKNAKYELSNKTVFKNDTLMISNEILDSNICKIKVHSGRVLVTQSD